MPVDTKAPERKAHKVYEREWLNNKNEYTKFHWECHKGNVYWFEVNVVVDDAPMVPSCIDDSDYWSQPIRSDE